MSTVKSAVKKMLSGHAPSERREHLKRYFLACVRDNVLSFADLMSAPDKLMRTISADTLEVAKDLGRSGMEVAGGALAEIVRDVFVGYTRRRK